MRYLELVGRSNEFRTVPEACCWLKGNPVGAKSDCKYGNAANVLDSDYLLHRCNISGFGNLNPTIPIQGEKSQRVVTVEQSTTLKLQSHIQRDQRS